MFPMGLNNNYNIVCARYELDMMTAKQKTDFEKLFKEKKFYEVPNPIYRGWLGFKIAVLGTEENVFDNILAAKTVTEIPRAKKKRVEGPTGAAKWDVTSDQNLALFKAREDEKAEKEARKKEAEEKKKEREEEREAKKKEKEEQIQEKKRQREEKREAAAAKRAVKAAMKAEKAKEREAVPGPSNTRKPESATGPSSSRRSSRGK